MRLAWLTDIHLNFVGDDEVRALGSRIAASGAGAALVGGDISEAPTLERDLTLLAEAAGRPIYFVLGNHDYYHGSIPAVRKTAAALCERIPELVWLPAAGVVPLADDVALVGHGGWGDGRLGDYRGSRVMLTDYFVIEELRGLRKAERGARLRALGREAGTYFRGVLDEACARFSEIVALTHVPPFREACWHEGEISADDWLPHFSCAASGDAMREAMEAHPRCRLTVLCGHTHGSGTARIRDNLLVRTGGADYGAPAIQDVLDLPADR